MCTLWHRRGAGVEGGVHVHEVRLQGRRRQAAPRDHAGVLPHGAAVAVRRVQGAVIVGWPRTLAHRPPPCTRPCSTTSHHTPSAPMIVDGQDTGSSECQYD